MSKIQVMDEILANKIAAGEVVEKTMNVVKELVENSIDASSSEIKIELLDSGIKEVKVIDNGNGMDREDAVLAFSRHATSKLRSLEDLFSIDTLGFRGEALPSIASVSDFTVKTSNGIEGTIIHLSGGKIQDINPTDVRQGTTMTVSHLFYNTPVRLKYLKNLYVELANIIEYVNKMALSYPSIQFTLTNNGKELLHTDGSGSLLKVIHAIYGLEVSKKMMEIDEENEDYHIYGYLGYPEVARSNRSHMTTLVNGRYIRNNELNRIISDSYHTYIPVDKYPILVLNIEVDPLLVDINIHPTKMDIKFSKMDSLKELVTKLISEELKKHTLIPTIKEYHPSNQEFLVKDSIQNIVWPSFPKGENNEKEEKVKLEEVKLDFNEEIVTTTVSDESSLDKGKIKKMYPIGLVHGTYIIAENEDGMFMIDQHAAAERINYEKYFKAMSEKSSNTIGVLFPITIELPNHDYIIVKEHLDLLRDIGFEVEEFGINTLLFRSHPVWLKKGYEEASLRKIIDIIISKETFDYPKFIEKTAITLACKMSIKANDHISLEDMEHLLNTLRECDNPFTCPHGRPTVITYTKYDLEKLFKRAMN